MNKVSCHKDHCHKDQYPWESCGIGQGLHISKLCIVKLLGDWNRLSVSVYSLVAKQFIRLAKRRCEIAFSDKKRRAQSKLQTRENWSYQTKLKLKNNIFILFYPASFLTWFKEMSVQSGALLYNYCGGWHAWCVYSTLSAQKKSNNPLALPRTVDDIFLSHIKAETYCGVTETSHK